MKKIKLFLLKLEYHFNCKVGPFITNERKLPELLREVQRLEKRIFELERA
jgi:hypothetical protein